MAFWCLIINCNKLITFPYSLNLEITLLFSCYDCNRIFSPMSYFLINVFFFDSFLINVFSRVCDLIKRSFEHPFFTSF